MNKKVTTKDITRMLEEQGWLFNFRMGQLILSGQEEEDSI